MCTSFPRTAQEMTTTFAERWRLYTAIRVWTQEACGQV